LYTPFDPTGWVFRAILSGTQSLIRLQDTSLTHSASSEKFLLGVSYENPTITSRGGIARHSLGLFLCSTLICPVLSKPERLLLQHFQFGLLDHAGLQLDALSEGSFCLRIQLKGRKSWMISEKLLPWSICITMSHQEESALSNGGLSSA
jgi:hypothetical protein